MSIYPLQPTRPATSLYGPSWLSEEGRAAKPVR
jgi:hypothetical protein